MEQVMIQDPAVSESLSEYGVVSSSSDGNDLIYNEEDVVSSTSDWESTISSSSRNTSYRNDEDRVTSSTDYDTVTSSMDSFRNGDTEVTSTSN